jgi:hypothetical protein
VKPSKIFVSLIISLSLLLAMSLTCQATTFNWVGGDGDWSVIANWECDPPSLSIPGPPGPGDTAVVHSGSVHIGEWSSIAAAALTVDSGAQLFIEGGVTRFEVPAITNNGLITLSTTVS